MGKVAFRFVFWVSNGGIYKEGFAGVLAGKFRCGLGQRIIGTGGKANVQAVSTEVVAHLTLHQKRHEFIELRLLGVLGNNLIELGIDFRGRVLVAVVVVQILAQGFKLVHCYPLSRIIVPFANC